MTGDELELWAGVECTVARIRDDYRDEVLLTGHETRLDDLDRLASMGARAIRYPVLWERVERDGWAWTDERLERLRELGLRPIVGLVHHGSGPRHTSLLDASFASGLADFARKVGARYPWVLDFTPVNEPLTTARFSALYGHWYPHARSDAAFTRALVNECVATARAMRAIREVTPSARLVQTEDVATVFSTPHLAYQAEFENHRRWASLDLLTGRVVPGHYLWRYFVDSGVSQDELTELAASPCPPDIIGLNYYVTSDRFLDEHLTPYPPEYHGKNAFEPYADVEAARARPEGIVGHRGVLSAAWQRYHLPVAITEAHHGCTREEQMRWLLEAWEGAKAARRDGADVRAVTVWSVFGSVDWRSLLTEARGHYETGAFDVRSTVPRETAIATMARDLAKSGASSHPVLATPGWWRRPSRFGHSRLRVDDESVVKGRPILLVGASGALGRAFVRALEQRGLAFEALDRRQLDISNEHDVGATIERVRPWAVINAAGYSSVRKAEIEPDLCRRDNALGPAILARAATDNDIRIVTFSSHYVFDGRAHEPYVESAPVDPLGVYGRSKADAERWVQAVAPSALVVRSSSFFGCAFGCTIARALHALASGRRVELHHDRMVSATYLPDLVDAVLDLLVDGESGIWHLVNAGEVSPFEIVKRAAQASGISDRALVPTSIDHDRVLPRYSVLGSERWTLLPPLEDAFARWASSRQL